MRSVNFCLSTVSLFSLMTITSSYPRNGGYPRFQPPDDPMEYYYRQSTIRYPGYGNVGYQSEEDYQNDGYGFQASTTPRPRWIERQQILQILMPTEAPRSERIVQRPGVKLANAVGNDRRGVYEDLSGDRRHLRQKPQSSHENRGRNPSTATRPTMGEIDRRIGQEEGGVRIVAEENIRIVTEELICDEKSSSTSQAHRRSPSQDSDSRSQHVHRSAVTTPSPPCKSITPMTYPSYKPVATTRSPPKRSKPGNAASSSLPRPPTTLRNVTSTPPPRRANTVKALGDIVFPDGNLFPSFVPRKDSCQGKEFCEDVPGYPTEYIDRLFEESEELFKGIFDDEEDAAADVNITQRIDMTEEIQLCPSIMYEAKPKAIQEKGDGDDDDIFLLFVVNDDKRSQVIRGELCANGTAGGSCSSAVSWPYGHTTFCEQKYIERKLVVLDKRGSLVTKPKAFPSCCSCRVVSNAAAARMGKISPPLQRRITPALRSNIPSSN